MAAAATLSILIPVFNERRLLPLLLEKVHAVLPNIRKQIVMVDDCSTDGTREWMRETLGDEESVLAGFSWSGDQPRPVTIRPGAGSALAANRSRVTIRALYHERNQGKGAALRTAIAHATGDVLVIQDADLEYDPQDLAPMWKLVSDGHADVVYGSRFYGNPHRCLYFHHFLANKLISYLFSILYNQILTDLEVCYKMFRREVCKHLTLRSNDFGFEIEFSANIARARTLRIYEVGISYFGRTYAEGKKINWRDGVKALWYVFRFRFC